MLLFVGSLQFIMGILLAEQMYPDYRVWQTISSLGVYSASEASALTFDSSLALEGLLVLAASYFLWLTYRNPMISALFSAGGVCAIGAAIFPQDVPDIHLGFSVVSFFVAGLVPFATLRIQHRPFSYFSIILGTLSFLFAVLLAENYTFGLPYGALERLVAYPTLLWALGFGAFLMNER